MVKLLAKPYQQFQTRIGTHYTADANGMLTNVQTGTDIADLMGSGALPLPANTPASGVIYRYHGNPGIGNIEGTAEEVLCSFSLPANALDIAGRTLQINATGAFADNGHSKIARVYFGSSIVATTGMQTVPDAGWQILLQVHRTGSGQQLGFYSPVVGKTHGGISLPLQGAENDKAAIAIKVTGQTRDACADDVILNSLLIEALN